VANCLLRVTVTRVALIALSIWWGEAGRRIPHKRRSARANNKRSLPTSAGSPAPPILSLSAIRIDMAAAVAAVSLLLFLSAQGAAPVLGFTRGDFPEDFVFGSATSAYQVTDAPIIDQCFRAWNSSFFFFETKTQGVFFRAPLEAD